MFDGIPATCSVLFGGTGMSDAVAAEVPEGMTIRFRDAETDAEANGDNDIVND